MKKDPMKTDKESIIKLIEMCSTDNVHIYRVNKDGIQTIKTLQYEGVVKTADKKYYLSPTNRDEKCYIPLQEIEFAPEDAMIVYRAIIQGKSADSGESIGTKFKDAPTGARYKLTPEDEETWIVIESYGKGLVVQWNGNVKGRQSRCCFVDDSANYTLDSIIYLI